MTAEIRVLHITAVPMTGAVIVAPIAQQQAKLGYKIEFACGDGEYLKELCQLGFPVTIVPFARRMLSLTHVISVYRLWRLMRQKQFHIVHVHTPIAAFLGRCAARLSKTPIIIYHMRGSFWDTPNLLMRTFFTSLERLAGRWTSHTFTINCTDANELISRNIADPKTVTCLHCGGGGVNIEKFDSQRFTQERITRLRQELGIKEQELVIGFIGRLVREKGVFELLSAFQKLTTANTGLKLLVVGGTLSSERDQESSKQLKKLLESDSDLLDRIIFTGFRSDIPEMMAIMDIVVLPSYREGFGMVLAEASAMAKPVISTTTRGGQEAIKHGENGFLTPIGEVSPLYEALKLLITHPSLRNQMGAKGRYMAETNFAEQIVFKKIEAEYEQLLKANNLSLSRAESGA